MTQSPHLGTITVEPNSTQDKVIMAEQLYPEHESTRIEFKRELPENNQILKTAIAFCNAFGGQIIVGVADNGEIVGIDENLAAELLERLPKSIYDSTSPPVLPQCYLRRLGTKVVVVLEVAEGGNKPYFITAEGLGQGTYVRLGSNTIRATGATLEELRWTGTGRESDAYPVHGATIDDLDADRILRFLKSRRGGFPKRSFDVELLLSYRILIQEQARTIPTIGGVLCFGKDIEKFLSESFVICTEFIGRAGREARSSRDFKGQLMQRIDGVLDFLNEVLPHSFSIKKTIREDRPEIPTIALREAVVNAVVHRNYHLPGPIKIAVYQDHVEIFSPGVFPGPIVSAYESRGITYIRNAVIGRIFREAGYVEKLGSGFATIFDSCAKAQLPTPQFIQGPNYIKCILYRSGGTVVKSMDSQDRFVAYIAEKGEVAVSTIQKAFSISRATAQRHLAALTEQGLITRSGRGPATRYRIGGTE